MSSSQKSKQFPMGVPTKAFFNSSLYSSSSKNSCIDDNEYVWSFSSPENEISSVQSPDVLKFASVTAAITKKETEAVKAIRNATAVLTVPQFILK
jgi:hypothetical protein